jgi:hypothetical protein
MRESKFFDEIIALGAIEARRVDVLEVLKERLGAGAAAEFTEALNGITDNDKLSELLRLASKTRAINSFRRALTVATR